MTPEEAIQQLEFDRAMILFDSLTGEEITPEMLKLINKENYLTYVADGIAIEALKKIQQYREIGTVEECREAAEGRKAKKARFYAHNFYCPECGEIVGNNEFNWTNNFCRNCGQAIRWENLGEMEDERD